MNMSGEKKMMDYVEDVSFENFGCKQAGRMLKKNSEMLITLAIYQKQ